MTYLFTIGRSIEFHGGRTHPKDRGAGESRAYLSHLAVVSRAAASTQNVAFSALLFLSREVLHLELPAIENVERAGTWWGGLAYPAEASRADPH